MGSPLCVQVVVDFFITSAPSFFSFYPTHSKLCSSGIVNCCAFVVRAEERCRRNSTARSHEAVLRVYDAAGNVIETHGHKGDFKGCS